MSQTKRHIIMGWVRFACLSGLVALGLGGAAGAQAPSVGSAEANPAVLARVFVAACMQSSSLGDAQQMLANASMVPNPETGTYFHQQFDMSVNPAGERCSMVFSVEDANLAADTFRTSAATMIGVQATDIEILQLDGVAENFFRASVEARW